MIRKAHLLCAAALKLGEITNPEEITFGQPAQMNERRNAQQELSCQWISSTLYTQIELNGCLLFTVCGKEIGNRVCVKKEVWEK
ncbi:hypothetical protein TNIN_275921 [Trichonephila inaurata madagascariensis]|uniref:Uncharacterized protein n=1 Tax=Trichonephila inaurata madagascariensis TaxID=2747483 RepID=A0A8X6XW49_9ARAC|nr:hypothetical protein TNIN_275921 [Trichonephila inaurata madagascariensis]